MERVRFTENRAAEIKFFKGAPALLITTAVFAIGNIVATEMLGRNKTIFEMIKKHIKSNSSSEES